QAKRDAALACVCVVSISDQPAKAASRFACRRTPIPGESNWLFWIGSFFCSFSPMTTLTAALPLSAATRPSYKWWVVLMLWFVCFFNYADRQSITALFPLLQKEFGFGDVQLGWIVPAFAWVYAGFSLPAGLLVDRVSRKHVILAACIVWSAFTLGTAFCGGFAGFIIVRALTGLGETFYFPASLSLLSDYHSSKTRSRALSWHQSAVYAGTILGSWFSALLAERYGWRFPFYLFGPIGILLALVLYVCLREPRRGAADAQD